VTAHDRLRSWRWLHLWLPVVGWMVVIFCLSAQPDLPHPQTDWADLLFASSAHAFFFGVLAVLSGRALRERPRAVVLAFFLVALYALSDEFHQAFVPGRTPDLVDLVCDLLGAAAGLWLWKSVPNRLKI
jgi:VanZ family protein